MSEGLVGSRLPPDAEVDVALLQQLASFPDKLPLWQMMRLLVSIQDTRKYDAARAVAQERFLEVLPGLLARVIYGIREFTHAHLDVEGRLQVARRLSRDRNIRLRRWANQLLAAEGMLPVDAWDWTKWTERTRPGRLYRHQTGAARQRESGVAVVENLGELRALLGIRSEKQLGWMLLASDGDEQPYHTFKIPKSNGELRQIEAPRPQLKQVQRMILRHILSRVPAHESVHGFVRGRSTVTNAAAHVGQHLLMKFDLKDFFPTVHYWRVVGLFAQLGYDPGQLRLAIADDSRAVAPVLARLCVYAADPEAFGGGYTPQGAPTSPMICNLICRGMDARLAGLTEELGGVYTRYADDLTFSFPEEPKVGRLRWWVEEICRQEGFTVNHRKFRVIRRSQQQRVTGVVVNDKLSVPRAERRRFRAILYNCRKHGVASQARGRPDFVSYLRGFASYVYMVQPDRGRALMDEVEALIKMEGA
ncbi:MAG: reverse transcriptase family protein [Myxococcota bacterium]